MFRISAFVVSGLRVSSHFVRDKDPSNDTVKLNEP